MGWPSPLLPDALEGRCAVCRTPAVCVLVYVDHDDAGRPVGPFELRCLRCQRADGDPFAYLHGTTIAAIPGKYLTPIDGPPIKLVP